MKCACIKCADRTAECHSTCDRYVEWKQYMAKRKKTIQEAKAPNYDYIDWTPSYRKRVTGK